MSVRFYQNGTYENSDFNQSSMYLNHGFNSYSDNTGQYDLTLRIGAQQLDLPGNVITIDGEMGLVFLIDGTVCLLQ